MSAPATIFVALAVLAGFAAAVAGWIRSRKKGGSGCSGGCDGCPGRDLCRPDKDRGKEN